MATTFVRYLDMNNNVRIQGILWLESSKIIKFRAIKRGFEFFTPKDNNQCDVSLEQFATVVHDYLNGESNFTEITGYGVGTEVMLTYGKTSIWVSDKNESVQEICDRWNEMEKEIIIACSNYYLVGVKTCNNKIRDIQMIFSISEKEARKKYKVSSYEKNLTLEDIVVVGIFNVKDDVIILKEYSCYFNINKLKNEMENS